MTPNSPGRICPAPYRYSPALLAGPATLATRTLYVIGGLYGNPQALEAVQRLRELEDNEPVLVFNGDFNWFDVDEPGFVAVNQAVLEHVALRGNVETELASDDESAGCGCAYPEWVGDGEVERSNEIMQRLKAVGRRFPVLRERLAALPMALTAEVGDTRIGIVHGDAESLAGWRFSQESLASARHHARIAAWFEDARVRAFACSHTCLPVLKEFGLAAGKGIVINNGAAGMPNFRGRRHGVISRISVTPCREVRPLYQARLDGLWVSALPVRYDHVAWRKTFLANWPAGSPAHESYHRRIVSGPDYQPRQALRLISTEESRIDSAQPACGAG
ncbi:MAG: hypothetical protein HYU77_04460 [Betaproteobacteria bacterium]|nr:hypothetical protein [Betaproteobacteria bacterium]